ncbi:drug resistance transporter, Bcr/CflA subfamily [Gluconacetobacter diazotrophicus PA1 5]|nr:multidrug effflux MFS transporter [Gluconacetobacter diazotrophicus]ACI51254.1 drug resistance transporter, Bcr/CflA subfamily [Gluconacetobacter diazotrophicus PA1 5]TWB09802.1 DHA1 family bicyclomycin/chloramphenicol resistance-like MFS transporter [Gluconacetobacter diazotrophicus]
MMIKTSPFAMTAVLAILTAVGPISTDMYLPAFGAMTHALGGAHGDAEMTLAAWFLGLSVGQVTHGAIADHYGRRGPLLGGTLLYTIASVGCAVAGSMWAFSLWRFVAAFGAAASLVIPRAVIRDVVGGDGDAARMLGRMVLVMSIVPMLAPTLGGVIAEDWQWRGIFWIAAAYGACCVAMVYWLLPDTLTTELHMRFRLEQAVTGYVLILHDRVFRLHALEGGCATFTLFAFLGGAPRVFVAGYGLSPVQFGGIFILNAAGYAVGTNINGRLVPRLGAPRVLSGAAVALAVACGGMFAAALLHVGGGILQVGGITLCMAILGFLLPGAALGSVLPNGARAATASALYGTVVFFIGSFSTMLVGWLGTRGPASMTGLMLLGALMALACDWRRR